MFAAVGQLFFFVPSLWRIFIIIFFFISTVISVLSDRRKKTKQKTQTLPHFECSERVLTGRKWTGQSGLQTSIVSGTPQHDQTRFPRGDSTLSPFNSKPKTQVQLLKKKKKNSISKRTKLFQSDVQETERGKKKHQL